MMKPETD